MKRFGFNINFKLSPEDIRNLGKEFLGTGKYHAIEVTYYENMHNVDTLSYNEAIKEIVDAYHPQVLVHISDFNLSEENTTLREAIFQEAINCICYTKKLGGKEIIVHTGNESSAIHVPIYHEPGDEPRWGELKEKAWMLSVEMMQRICDAAKEEGITIYTENINHGMNTKTTEQIRKYLTDVNRDNLQMVFDVGHCNLAGYDIVSEVRQAKGILQHLHIHDNHGPKNEGWLDEHATLGEGLIDFKEFVNVLQEISYDGLYMMELRLCTEEALTISRDTLLKILGNES